MRLNIDAGETSAAAAILTMLGAAYRWFNPTRDRLDRLEGKIDDLYKLILEKN